MRVNNDTLKTPAKCLEVAKESVIAGKSVCIDNTNKSKANRLDFIKLAKEYKLPVRAVFFEMEKLICLKNNQMRKDNQHRLHFSNKVPKIAIHVWFKNLEVPEMSEGYDDIVTIGFLEKFENEKDEETYKLF